MYPNHSSQTEMLLNFGSGIRLQSGNKPFFFSIFKPPQTLTLTMATLSAPNPRRPTCPSCTRPTHFCLCTRFKTPVLNNSIPVTILQHTLEKKHPLNSAKIAILGLKNTNLIHISDVSFESHFDLHLLEPNRDLGPRDSDQIRKKIESCQPGVISFTIEKKGVVTSFRSIWDQKAQDFDELLLDRARNDGLRNGFDEFLLDQAAIDRIRDGFVVKKRQRDSDDDDGKYVEEFEIAVPRGSVVLFPSEDSIGVEDVDFDVKNLIVLDGTWSKATKMYKENPWLKLLPNLRLDVEKLSLYGEVRRQPRAGCLSSIESIVYALKAIGEEDVERLDCLLDVFESMVVDQRRCKDERLKGMVD